MYYIVKKNGDPEQVFETKKDAREFIEDVLGSGVIEKVISLETAVKAAEKVSG